MIILTVTHPHIHQHTYTRIHILMDSPIHTPIYTHISTPTPTHTHTHTHPLTHIHMLNTLSDTFTKAHTCTFLAPSPSHSKSHFAHLSLFLSKSCHFLSHLLSLSLSLSRAVSPPLQFPRATFSLSHTFSPSKALVHHSQQVSQSIVLLGNNLIGKRCQKL